MGFDPGGDLCLGFFGTFWNDGRCPTLRPGASVLEIGCAEADWLQAMRATRPDLHLTGIDWRPHPRPAASVQICGDVLAQSFPAEEFDAIVAVSMLEWAGIGQYRDPIYPDGDSRVMQRAHEWIRPEGWLYFDVPYATVPPPRKRNQRMRVYTEADLQTRLLQGLWREVDREHFTGNGHPDGPYVALVVRPN